MEVEEFIAAFSMSDQLAPGLHIVATPIGNLGDLSPRAAETLRRADRVLVEDTRVTAKLLAHIGAKVPMGRYNDHTSEAERASIRYPAPWRWSRGKRSRSAMWAH